MTSRDPITPRARDLFDRASSRLDPDDASRLRRIRRDALDGPPVVRARPMLVPAGAFAAALLALGLAWWMPPGQTVASFGPEDAAAASQLDGLMIEEDPDLYAWLADAPVATGKDGQR